MNNIPAMTKNLLVINLLAFLATTVFELRGIDLTAMLGLHFFLASDFHIYQLLTYMFLHGSFTHILFNMFALWMFGSVIERVWGPRKFLFYYMVCGIGAGLVQELVQYINYGALAAESYVSLEGSIMPTGDYLNLLTTIGASGAVYGILLAFGMIFPNERLFIIPIPFPIKAKWLIVGYVAIEFFSAMSSSGDGVAHMAHLGGMLFGYLLIRHWQRHPGASQRFGRSKGMEFFDNMKRKFDERQQGRHTTASRQAGPDPRRETDAEYNARKQQRQAEIDAILDKIRKSGYDSLTKEEKQKLFEQSRNT